MGYHSLNKYYSIFFLIFLTVFLAVFFIDQEVLALIKISPITPDFIPAKTIVLDESSTQEIIYISSDQSILVFKNTTPQLEQLHPGDVLLLQLMEDIIANPLFQIKHIIRGKLNNKVIIIEVIPWQNHPPFISALIAQPSTLEIGQRAYISCYAADEDGELLHYTWISSAGTISGNGPGITWIAPEQPGSYSISCEVGDQAGDRTVKSILLSVIEKLPLFSDQEKELMRRFGWGGNRIIRWPDGYVEVYDATNFSHMQEVLDQWNNVTGGKVIFNLSNNPQSPVRITFNSALGKENLCGHIDTHWRSYKLYAAEMTINPDRSFCGFPKNSFGLYLHLFSGVAGFNIWKGEVIEKRDWQNFTLISEIMQIMIKALHKVQPGYNLNRDL